MTASCQDVGVVNFGCVFLARHGQTEWNREGRRQGQLDSPLTARGWNHARALASYARTLTIDGLLCSPLGRAQVTARVCSDTLGMELVVLDELAEVHHGVMAGMTNDEIDVAFPGQLAARRRDPYSWRFPDGESYADADHRAGLALAVAAERGYHHPLIVSHEMIGRMLLRNLLEWPPDKALPTQQPHTIMLEVLPESGSVHRLEVGA